MYAVKTRRGLRGLGDCLVLPGYPASAPMCRDNNTGNLVFCNNPVCGQPSNAPPPDPIPAPAPSPTPQQITTAVQQVAAAVNPTPALPAPGTQPVPSSMETVTVNGMPTQIPRLTTMLQTWLQEVETESVASLVNEGLKSPDAVAQEAYNEAHTWCAEQGGAAPECSNPDSYAAPIAAAAKAFFANVPPSQWNLATFTPYAQPPAPATPPPAAPIAPAGPAASLPTSPQAAPSVSIRNLTGPSNAQFQVGDQWQIVVQGAPNQAVSAAASQNGSSLGTTPFGSTDASGRLVLNGTMGAGQVGQWVETWIVGGITAAPVLQFYVLSPASTTTTVTDNSTPTPPPPATTPAPAAPSWFDQPGLFGMPNWAVAGGGLLALMFMFGGHR